MNVTIQDAINAFALLSEHVNENGFLHECYNLGISALKTIQDGNYELSKSHVSRETLEKLANYECGWTLCSECKLYANELGCISTRAKEILKSEEVKEWIIKHEKK